jgi:predicted transcriptional regulator
MNFPELSSIKIKRQKLGVKQQELALKAGVSQSMIAKVESNQLLPSYDIAKRIFLTLESLEHNNEKSCKDIMTKHFISIQSSKKVKDAVELMKKHDISQIPVFDKKRNTGSISESGIYSRLTEGTDKKALFESQIKNNLEPPLPTISSLTPLSVALPLLKTTNAILLTDKDSIVGIITKSNVL